GRGDRVAARQSDVNEQDSPGAPSEDDAATRRSGIDNRTGRTTSQRPPPVDPVEPPPAKFPNRLGDLSALRQRRGLRRRRASMRHRRAKRISSKPSILRRSYALRALDRDLARFIPIFQTAGLDRRHLSLGLTHSTLSSSGMTGRGRRCHSKRGSIGEVRPGRSTSTIWSGPKNSPKPPRKWPRDLTTTERARAMPC